MSRRLQGLVGRLGKRQTNLGVAFAPDGRTWTGTYSGRVYVWHGNRLVKSLKGHSGRVNAVASGPMGMLSGDSKGNIKFWDAKVRCRGEGGRGRAATVPCCVSHLRVECVSM